MAAKTIKGTKNADALTGTNGDDVIYGLNGNDTISAGGGNDLVDGGAGDDSIDGGLGNDSLFGGLGNDTITDHDGSNLAYGGTGNDIIDLSGSIASVIYGDGFDSFKLQGGAVVPTDLATTLGNDVINGGSGGDTIYGDDGNNINGTAVGGADVVHGNDGADTIYGEGGNDQLFGDAGNDQLSGGAGNDTLSGGSGNDVLTGGAGNDVIDGGENPAGQNPPGQFSDTDTANYLVAGVTTGVNVNLALHTATDGMGGTDTLANIERVIGTQFDDVLTGGDPANNGNLLNETFEGRGGNDTITGGVANNWAEYRDAAGAVLVDLQDGKAWNDGDGGVDTLININRVRGSAFDDQIYGSDTSLDNRERFEGMAGNDHIDGRGGPDAVNYTSSPAAVTVDLAAGTASDGFGTTDTLVNIEGVRGSDFNDILYGSDNGPVLAEFFEGMAGNDFIDGRGGPDRIEYNFSPSAVMVDLSNGIATDGFGGIDHFVNIEVARGSIYNDTLIGGLGFDGLEGNDGNDLLMGGSGNEYLQGGAGDDTIDGGAGNDTAWYNAATSGATVNLVTGTASDGEGGTDKLSSIENVLGSAFDDTITSDAGANWVGGGAGNDSIEGGAGSDTLFGGIGNDIITDSDGLTTIDGGAGDDNITASGSDPNVIYGDGYNSINVQGNNVVITDLATSLGNDVINGGGGADAIYGDNGNNVNGNGVGGADVIHGNDGADTIYGEGGNDQLFGDAGNDQLMGGSGNDTLSGGARDDVLTGGAGNDLLDGGENPAGQFSDTDTANYLVAGVTTGVNVNLATHTATDGMGGTDTLVNIERVIGTQFDDILTGGDPANASNNDSETFEGRGGNDTITGGVANNWAEYRDAAGAVWVDLRDGKAWDDGDGGVDTLVNINRVRGSAFADQITGSNNDPGTNERFEGMAGNDTIDGAGGFDVVHYTSSPGPVTVDLRDGTASDGFSTTDTLVNIEGVRGSDFNDFLYGSNNPGLETFEGMAGDDYIDGRGGLFDRIEYNRSPSGVMVDLGNGIAHDGFDSDPAIVGIQPYTDTFYNIEAARGSLFNDTLIGSAGADTLDGNDGNDTLIGGLGNDTLIGGNGDDTFIYTLGDGADSIQGGADTDTLLINGTSLDDTVYVVLAAPSLPPVLSGFGAFPSVEFIRIDLDGGNDTFSYAGSGQNVTAVLGGNATGLGSTVFSLLNVENLTGGDGNDSLTGDDNANLLDGGLGIGFGDTLSGAGGNDTLIGGFGNDVLLGGDGDDIFLYGPNDGSDIIDGGNGNDTLAINGTSDNDSINVSWSGIGLISQIAENGSITNIETATLDLGSGNDTLSYFTNAGIVATIGGSASGFSGNIAGVENIWGGDGSDILTGDGGDNVLRGGPGNDTLSGGDGNDTLAGGGGEDTLSGGAGNDAFLFTFDTPDAMDGGDGTDTLVVTGSNFDDILEINLTNTGLISILGWQPTTSIENATLDMGGGNDTLSYQGPFGTTSVDVTVVLGGTASGFTSPIQGVENVISGSGNDSLTGDGNDNFLASGSGSDTLLGGGGNDTLRLVGDGTDVIDGGDGFDTLQIYSTADDFPVLHVIWSGSGMISGIGDGGTITGVEAVTLELNGASLSGDTLSYVGTTADLSVTLGGIASGFSGNIVGVENVIGGSGNDIITGDDVPVACHNSLAGEAGNDTLIGGLGFDTLSGGTGNDNLQGGADNDILTGGQGSDSLNGGAGADTFKWNAGDDGSVDRIADFDQVANSDKLDLKDLLIGEHYGVNGSPSNLDTFLSFHFDGTDTTINVSTTSGGAVTQQIVLQGVDITHNNGYSDSTIIQNLLTDGKLIVDA